MSQKVALITGITGQDGSYLAEFLLEKGYDVHGIIRGASTFNTYQIEHLYSDPQAHKEDRMKLHYGDLADSSCLIKIISAIQSKEIYYLGAESYVKISFDLSEYTAEVDGVGTLRLLDAIRTAGLSSSVKFYQVPTSELYGKVVEIPQKETSPFYPLSPYGYAVNASAG